MGIRAMGRGHFRQPIRKCESAHLAESRMNLLELLLAVEQGEFSCGIAEPDFADVLALLDGRGAGLFEGVVKTLSALRDGELTDPALVTIEKLSVRGSAILKQLIVRLAARSLVCAGDPEEFFSTVERGTDQWAAAAVPIFSKSQKRFVDAAGLGSGVVCSLGEELFFVTCEHVQRDFAEYEIVQANIGGRAFKVGSLFYKTDPLTDVAIARVSREALASVGIAAVTTVPLDQDWSEWKATGNFVAMGYPGTQNELKLAFNSTKLRAFAVFAKGTSARSRETKLAQYFALGYTRKSIRRSDGTYYGPPELAGMSGGPCFEIMKRASAEGHAYSFRFAGLVCEFRRQEPWLLIVDVAALLACLH